MVYLAALASVAVSCTSKGGLATLADASCTGKGVGSGHFISPF